MNKRFFRLLAAALTICLLPHTLAACAGQEPCETTGMDTAHIAPLSSPAPAEDAPPTVHTFTLQTAAPGAETGFAFCEGSSFTAGERVLICAEPRFGYVPRFRSDAEVEIWYLGAFRYELTMPDRDTGLTVSFEPIPGEPHFIRSACDKGFLIVGCDTDDDMNDLARPGEHVQFYVMPDEGFALARENITVTAGGELWEDWWFLGELVEQDPEDGAIIDGIYVFEAVMPDCDLEVGVTCTTEAASPADAIRIPVPTN